ncbi:hypothetical protein LSAT2_014618, partial [Lamellibrachia satsuma]
MATPTTMDRFNDQQYINWVKLGQALTCVTKALAPFCKDVIEKWHNTQKDKLGNTTCNAGCVAKHIRPKKKSWSISCGDNVCNKWLEAIAPQLHTHQCGWENSIVNEWPKECWQVAKVFMGPGQDPSNVDPHKTDALGLLQLMINCKLFHSHLDTQKATKVRLYMH